MIGAAFSLLSGRLGQIGLAAVLAAGLAGFLWAKGKQVEGLKARVALLEAQVATCEARAEDISEHKEREDEINNLDGDGLRDAAGEWLLPTE